VRRAAVALVLSVDDPAHPLFRLSPLYLAAFQEQERARERHGVMGRAADGAFAEWLQKVAGKYGL
jgi:hypothetical protein